jgi:cobaltochelatase CobS
MNIKPHHIQKKPLHEVFGLEKNADTLNGRGEPIPVSTFAVSPELTQYQRAVDPDHVWHTEDLKNMLLALETGMPLLAFGHKGTGKTTDLLQIAARTGRPCIRVQHTGNTEEAHVLGQWIVKGGDLDFQLGFLGIAMQQGMLYIADEYDFARPEVLAVYQPVMEGEPLVIKDAPPHLRVIKPAPGFAFAATGNTNGTGDATGLYQGTTVQNAANYDRFGIAIKKDYLPQRHEIAAIVKHTGIAEKEAEKLVKFATEIRTLFGAGKLSDTISTRALLNIANVGLRRAKMRLGIQLCYSNKLNAVDAQAIEGVAQRLYG